MTSSMNEPLRLSCLIYPLTQSDINPSKQILIYVHKFTIFFFFFFFWGGGGGGYIGVIYYIYINKCVKLFNYFITKNY